MARKRLPECSAVRGRARDGSGTRAWYHLPGTAGDGRKRMLNDLSFWILVVVTVPVFWLLPARFRYSFLGVASSAYLA